MNGVPGRKEATFDRLAHHALCGQQGVVFPIGPFPQNSASLRHTPGRPHPLGVPPMAWCRILL